MLLQYETNRLILKVLGPDYASDVLRFYEQDVELFEKYEADRHPHFYTENHQRTVLQLEQSLFMRLQLVRFYVYLKEDPDTIIGTVSLYEISRAYGRAALGYKFASAHHHKGYATEALEKLISLAFGELELHRLYAHVQPDNTPSIQLLERLGFTYEGICRSYMRMRGCWTDHGQYSLLSTDAARE